MAMSIAIMGESGSGKTTAMRTLPPEATVYIDCDGKGLSWRGWRDQYNSANKNYFATSDKELITKLLVGISEKNPNIKYIVLDTMNAIMIDDEFSRMGEKNYDKWADLAAAIYGLVCLIPKLRMDLTVLSLYHTQTERDDSGNVWTRIKTSGRKLDKIVLESKYTTVLHAKAVNGKYIFETHANNSTAKTPLGAFESEVDNDIMKVIKAMEEYR